MLFPSLYSRPYSGLLVLVWMISFILAGLFDVFSIASLLHHVRGHVPAWYPWAGVPLTVLAIVLLPPRGTEFIKD